MPRVRKIPREEAEREEQKRAIGGTPTPPAPTGNTSYPRLSDWIFSRGWVEFGSDEFSASLIRIIDQGGLIWESSADYTSLDALLRAAEQALAELEAQGEL